ncbi:MAG: ATPase [Anaerolineae bacterium]|nr:ATPase [Anaerolineae bacterium]
MTQSLALGIDVGSTTVKLAVLDATTRELLDWRYVRANGRPRQTLLKILAENDLLASANVACVGFTGSGGGPIGAMVNAGHINELVAQTRAVSEFYPEARTVIEIGGQDSKLLILERQNGRTLLVDFAMNTLCAAGTGSFLDQQAERLGIAIEEEFAALALQSTEPARIAGRCTVFAKSDMIHLQQKGVPMPDILAGLCYALVRNFRSVIGRGKPFEPPILFQGGVAYNRAVVRAFADVLGTSITVPKHHTLMAAFGAALESLDTYTAAAPFAGFAPLQTAQDEENTTPSSLPPLNACAQQFAATLPASGPCGARGESIQPPTSEALFLGIDVGSISTNVALLDEQKKVVAWRYLRTGGQPLEAVRQGLREIGEEIKANGHNPVRGVGVTGSGRYLTGYFVGADTVRNEITAQAAAAVHFDPTVDTVFEIGGQDSKFIRLDRGAVVDFTMNKACAAGTGSFLEEQAERLAIDVESDFSPLAMASACPAAMGERCTVFMESDLIHHQQQGAQIEDLTAGLAYAVAHNYIHKVVNGRPIGQRVFFQGGVASNAAVVAAFGQILGRHVSVPPHHDVSGAIGAALLAMESAGPETAFKGFDLENRDYTAQTFECKACPNLCEVSKVTIAGEPPMYYGARCERFEEAGRKKQPGDVLPDLFAERMELLLGPDAPPAGGPRVGITRTLTFYDLYPYWRALFAELGATPVLSDVTHPHITANTAQTATAETCFPVKVIMGHVLDLLDKDCDFIFLPGVVNRENPAPGQTHNTHCPFIQASPWIAAAAIDMAARGARPLHFPLHLLWQNTLLKEFRPLAGALGVSMRRMAQAVEAGQTAQRAFHAAVRVHGDTALENWGDRPAAVLVGRPYNLYDPGLNQDLSTKIRKLGVLPIPMDYLPVRGLDISDRFDNMFWRSGQDILAAARYLRERPNLHALYVTNFACGPDSFLISFFRRELAEKPFLELEFDDHTADAGLMTRCEAFFDSVMKSC